LPAINISQRLIQVLKSDRFSDCIEKNTIFEFIGQRQKCAGSGAMPDTNHIQVKLPQVVDYLGQLVVGGFCQVQPA